VAFARRRTVQLRPINTCHVGWKDALYVARIQAARKGHTRKRMRDRLRALRAALYQNRHLPVPVQGEWLQRVLRRYFTYHGVPGNIHRLVRFRTDGQRAWRHALLRRSQRRRVTWARMARLTERWLGGCHARVSSILGLNNASTLRPKAGAQCGNSARWDLRGGRLESRDEEPSLPQPLTLRVPKGSRFYNKTPIGYLNVQRSSSNTANSSRVVRLQR
jgi:hypothetical protein